MVYYVGRFLGKLLFKTSFQPGNLAVGYSEGILHAVFKIPCHFAGAGKEKEKLGVIKCGICQGNRSGTSLLMAWCRYQSQREYGMAVLVSANIAGYALDVWWFGRLLVGSLKQCSRRYRDAGGRWLGIPRCAGCISPGGDGALGFAKVDIITDNLRALLLVHRGKQPVLHAII